MDNFGKISPREKDMNPYRSDLNMLWWLLDQLQRQPADSFINITEALQNKEEGGIPPPPAWLSQGLPELAGQPTSLIVVLTLLNGSGFFGRQLFCNFLNFLGPFWSKNAVSAAGTVLARRASKS